MTRKSKGVLTPEQKKTIDEYKASIIHNCIAIASNYKITQEEKIFIIEILKSITQHHVSHYDKRIFELTQYDMMVRSLYFRYAYSYYNSSAAEQLFPLEAEIRF